jgi:hypothetical protein
MLSYKERLIRGSSSTNCLISERKCSNFPDKDIISDCEGVFAVRKWYYSPAPQASRPPEVTVQPFDTKLSLLMMNTNSLPSENASCSYSGDAQFELRPGQQLSWLMFLIFVISYRQMLGRTSLHHGRSFQALFISSIVYHPNFRRYVASLQANERWAGVAQSVQRLATGWTGSEFECRWAQEFYLLQTGSGVHPTSYPVVTGSLSPGVKRPGCEADHSPPSSAQVKKMWIYTSTPPYAFMT